MFNNSRIKIFIVSTILLCLIFASKKSYQQTTLQLKLAPVGMHFFKEPNNHLFENRIDANSLFVVEPCVMLGVETYILSDELCFRAIVGGLSDAVSKPGFFVQIGLKERLFQIWRNSLSIGLSGSIYGRECWETIPGYTPQKSWKKNGDWEYSIGYMADIEYALFINDKSDILVNIIYGHQPKTFTISVGYRYWLSSVIKNPKKCGSCPFTKTKHWNI